jgi:asparagine synthase (glutamine-hydrolysing)
LPEDVVSRPKRGFTLPFDPWMRSALRDFCERRLGPQGLAGRGLFSAPALARLWASFLAGSRETTWSRVWMLVVLEAWLDRHGIEAEAVS